MEKTYKHLNQIQRDRIQALKLAGHKQKDIARILEINESTVSRELRRNSVKDKKTGIMLYKSSSAQVKSKQRRKNAKYQGKKINGKNEIEQYILNRFKDHWSPDDIAGRSKKDKRNLGFSISKNSIYRWLYSSYGQRYCKYLCTKRYGNRKRREKKIERTLIPNRTGIELRFTSAGNRSRYGHFEADTIVSGKKTRSRYALSVLCERKSRYIDIRKFKNLKPDTNNVAIKRMASRVKKVKSITFDNGIENVRHEEIGVNTFFCDPYSSWQKGSIENVNRMIRRFIPKGCDISLYSDKYVKKIVDIMNSKPRKILGYATALEVMRENSLFRE